jgi:hypothetical protein
LRAVLAAQITRPLAAAVLLVSLAGCGGGGANALKQADLRRGVLQLADLGPSFAQLENGPGAAFDAPRGASRLGRIAGFEARFRNRRAAEVVSDRVDLFPSASAAGKQLDAYRQSFAATAAAGAALPPPAIGDGAAAYRLEQASTHGTIRFFGIAWRHENAVAYLVVQGHSTLTAAAAQAMARRQERRLGAAG